MGRVGEHVLQKMDGVENAHNISTGGGCAGRGGGSNEAARTSECLPQSQHAPDVMPCVDIMPCVRSRDFRGRSQPQHRAQDRGSARRPPAGAALLRSSLPFAALHTIYIAHISRHASSRGSPRPNRSTYCVYIHSLFSLWVTWVPVGRQNMHMPLCPIYHPQHRVSCATVNVQVINHPAPSPARYMYEQRVTVRPPPSSGSPEREVAPREPATTLRDGRLVRSRWRLLLCCCCCCGPKLAFARVTRSEVYAIKGGRS